MCCPSPTIPVPKDRPRWSAKKYPKRNKSWVFVQSLPLQMEEVEGSKIQKTVEEIDTNQKEGCNPLVVDSNR
jgi:hypothetical protein